LYNPLDNLKHAKNRKRKKNNPSIVLTKRITNPAIYFYIYDTLSEKKLNHPIMAKSSKPAKKKKAPAKKAVKKAVKKIAKKASPKKASSKKPLKKKAVVKKKPAIKKAAAKKASPKKVSSKKAAAKKPSKKIVKKQIKKAPVKKAVVKKPIVKKSVVKKPAAKKATGKPAQAKSVNKSKAIPVETEEIIIIPQNDVVVTEFIQASFGFEEDENEENDIDSEDMGEMDDDGEA
jgi:hypothetical protein